MDYMEAIEKIIREAIKEELNPIRAYWEEFIEKKAYTTQEVVNLCRLSSERALHGKWRRGNFPPPIDVHSRPYKWSREEVGQWRKNNLDA